MQCSQNNNNNNNFAYHKNGKPRLWHVLVNLGPKQTHPGYLAKEEPFILLLCELQLTNQISQYIILQVCKYDSVADVPESWVWLRADFQMVLEF